MDYLYLDKIKSPSDIKNLNNEQLKLLCKEIRDRMLDTVSQNGGHLASGLGTVELTVALHKCFNAPEDTIIFDVGHQCYTHKLLTGRFDEFSTLRRENGISGFIRPQESVYDSFISGHSSTSISSAVGVSKANEILGNGNYSVAVIGDGAMTGGMVYEAFNNINKSDKHFIVILNDNKMSISKNRSSISKHLTKIRTEKRYFTFKSGVERFLIKIPLIGGFLKSAVFHFKLMLKNAIYKSNIFESLGFYYMGPVDGHDLNKLSEILEIAKEQTRPVLIHVKTIKGKGYKPAELNPDVYHGISKFDRELGFSAVKKDTFSSVFGETLTKLAEKDDKICAVTAAMVSGTGLTEFSERFKDRFFDVGIAEEHAVTFTAALSKSGLKPVFAVYSTFLQRSYDQIIHDAAIEGLPLTLAVDRAGFVGDDGETHQGLFDVSYLSSIPGVTIYSPATYKELKNIIKKRLKNPKGICAIRYPRGSEKAINCKEFTDNKGFTEFDSGDIVIVTYGILTANAVDAMNALRIDGINVSVIKLDTVYPLPDGFIDTLKEKKSIYFFEEGIEDGSIAEKTAAMLLKEGYRGKFKSLAVNGFVKQASVDSQRKHFNLDTDSMIKIIREEILS